MILPQGNGAKEGKEVHMTQEKTLDNQAQEMAATVFKRKHASYVLRNIAECMAKERPHDASPAAIASAVVQLLGCVCNCTFDPRENPFQAFEQAFALFSAEDWLARWYKERQAPTEARAEYERDDNCYACDPGWDDDPE